MITCVVADDHPALVGAVSGLLGQHDIQVVGRAQDGVAALAAIETYRPSVAVLDVVMPLMGGIEVARRASRSVPGTASVIYTGISERQLLLDALDAGARGFTLKEAPLVDLVTAVQLAARGEAYVDPALAGTLVRASLMRELPELGRREREVLRLLAEGMSNEEIGRELHIAASTAQTYLRHAMRKLEATTRTQAVAIAIRQSLIS